MTQLELFPLKYYQDKTKLAYAQCFSTINEEIDKLFNTTEKNYERKITDFIRGVRSFLNAY